MTLNLKLLKGNEIIITKKNIEYIKNESSLSFNLDNMHHTINFETKEFTRENDEYIFFLDWENKNCEITLKKEQYHLQVLVEYANLLENKNIYELSYFIETDDSNITLILELEGEEPW